MKKICNHEWKVVVIGKSKPKTAKCFKCGETKDLRYEKI